VAAASLLPWSEYRWLTAVITAGLAGGAVLLIWTRTTVAPRTWILTSCLCIAAAISVLATRQSQVSECTAVNASGRRVVIGTQLTAYGAKYRAEYPEDDRSAMLESLGALSPSLMWTEASIRRCRILLAVMAALWAPLLGVAALAGVRALSEAAPRAVPAPRQQIFISYNHADAAIARKLCGRLKSNGLEVAIDTDTMQPGERIAEFIDRAVRESDVVLSVVSNSSLLSAWVAMEAIQTLNRNKWIAGRLLIGCYLDDDFFRPGFRLECTRRIDQRLREIEELIPEYAERRIDTLELNEEKTRLYDLRNHLGTILATLKNSLCLDIREPEFESSVERIVAAVRELRNPGRNAAATSLL
jgi:hypothetical protein